MMYIHIGNGVTVKRSDVIGVFDLDTSTVSAITRKFINKKEKEGIGQGTLYPPAYKAV